MVQQPAGRYIEIEVRLLLTAIAEKGYSYYLSNIVDISRNFEQADVFDIWLKQVPRGEFYT